MAWQSIFDLGACDVVVNDFGTILFNQPMTKGQSANFQDPGSLQQYTIAVDANGSVSLSSPSALASSGMQVIVSPTFPIADFGIQASGIVLDAVALSAKAISDPAAGNSVSLVITGTSASPDPCDLTLMAMKSEIAILASVGI